MTTQKNFKLFGKIGVLDIIIILLLIIGIFFALRFSVNTNAGAAANTQKVSYTILITKKKPGLEKDIIIGQKAFDSLKGSEIGVVSGYNVIPYKTTQPNGLTGDLIRSEVQGLYDIEVTITADAKVSQSGVMIGDYDVNVGKEMFIKSKSFASPGYCIGLDLEGGKK